MDQYVVIGHPVTHSLSPEIHLDFARQLEQDIVYQKIDAPIDQFESVLTDFLKKGGKGANITLPFKERAFHFTKDKTQAAIEAMAANTLIVQDDGTILADNTDGIGFIQDLTRNHNYSVQGQQVLVLGAGGAVRGILGALLDQMPEKLVIANRTLDKAIYLVEHHALKGNLIASSLDDLPAQSFDLIIHGTSAGVQGELPSLPSSIVNEQTWCYDLVYNRQEDTPFVAWAKKAGASKALDGLGMLVEQAAASFYLWRGVYPDTQPVIKDLKLVL